MVRTDGVGQGVGGWDADEINQRTAEDIASRLRVRGGHLQWQAEHDDDNIDAATDDNQGRSRSGAIGAITTQSNIREEAVADGEDGFKSLTPLRRIIHGDDTSLHPTTPPCDAPAAAFSAALFKPSSLPASSSSSSLLRRPPLLCEVKEVVLRGAAVDVRMFSGAGGGDTTTMSTSAPRGYRARATALR